MEWKRMMPWLAAGGGWMVARTALRRFTAYDLRQRTVLITGGSRGLGLVLARRFLAEGARVAICARDGDELSRARWDLSRLGSEVHAVTCDVTRREQVDAMVREVQQRLGPIDVLVNNAGVIEVGPVELMSLADYEEAMATNFWAALYTMLAVLPQMYQRQDGRIINIASIGGKISVPHLVPYSASKFALVGLSEGLHAELQQHGIHVTTVCPGLMRTGSPRNAYFKGQNQKEYAWFSIGGALPLSSMSADKAARRIVDACRFGEAEVVLSWQAKVLVKLHALFPGLGQIALGLVDRLLPGPGGIGSERRQGKDSQSAWSPSLLTDLSDRAAEQNNETTRGARKAGTP